MNQWHVESQSQWREPSDVFTAPPAEPYCVWLDSALPGAGQYSIFASCPFQVMRFWPEAAEIETRHETRRVEGNAFDVLLREMEKHRHEMPDTPPAAFPVGAAIGCFGYDLKNQIENLPARARNDLGLPHGWFGFYDHYTVFDHQNRTMHDVCRQPPLPSVVAPPRPTVMPAPSDAPLITSNFTREAYCAAVQRVRQYIAAGDAYQVNLSQRFQCRVNADAPSLYRVLRAANPAPYAAYVDTGHAQVLSSSPECFLKMTGRDVITRPIKGTRRRTGDAATDERLAAELLRSEKDNAELVMITDLERNDLGRVCAYGSVRVDELVRVESYATVLHLVATVSGRLRPEVSHVDCVRACFPGGSITGAPKIRAMQIIDELEPHARGVYCGAIGFFGFNEVSHFNIAIRTLVYQGGRVTFHAGGGIVTDSVPQAEYEETLAKAEGIIHAIHSIRLCERPVLS